MESGVRSGTYLDPDAGSVPFREYAESWVKGQSSDASSRQSIESRLRSQLYPFFDRRPVDAIGPAPFVTGSRGWRSGGSTGRIGRSCSTLSLRS
jgi:hypothetical protein